MGATVWSDVRMTAGGELHQTTSSRAVGTLRRSLMVVDVTVVLGARRTRQSGVFVYSWRPTAAAAAVVVARSTRHQVCLTVLRIIRHNRVRRRRCNIIIIITACVRIITARCRLITTLGITEYINPTLSLVTMTSGCRCDEAGALRRSYPRRPIVVVHLAETAVSDQRGGAGAAAVRTDGGQQHRLRLTHRIAAGQLSVSRSVRVVSVTAAGGVRVRSGDGGHGHW